MILRTIITTGLLLFLIGIVIRIVRMATMPLHVRWELYPIPKGAVGRARVMFSEIFLLKGVFERNRPIWLWSWMVHGSLYLLILAALLSMIASFSGGIRGFIAFIIAVISNISYVCGAVGSGGLIAIRLISPRLRPYTSFAVFFNLAILLAMFMSGLAHSILQPAAANIIVEQAGSLLGLNPAPSLHSSGLMHLVLIAFFLAYFPLTQMAHAVLKYFTYHSVRWDDRPVSRKNEEQMRHYLAYPVSWSAPHIQDGSGRSWMDLVRPNETGSDGANGKAK